MDDPSNPIVHFWLHHTHAHVHAHTHTHTHTHTAYGYGFLMAIAVASASVFGVLVVPLVQKNSKFGRFYKYFKTLMIALGVSALFCDAILHLIPHVSL